MIANSLRELVIMSNYSHLSYKLNTKKLDLKHKVIINL